MHLLLNWKTSELSEISAFASYMLTYGNVCYYLHYFTYYAYCTVEGLEEGQSIPLLVAGCTLKPQQEYQQ